jgi:hypothetical protein
MPLRNKLNLYANILPAVAIIASDDSMDGEPLTAENVDSDKYQCIAKAKELVSELPHAEIFDCRQLPVEFVGDTGEAALHEIKQTGKTTQLPFSYCYFEFADRRGPISIFAYEIDQGGGLETIEFLPFHANTYDAFTSSTGEILNDAVYDDHMDHMLLRRRTAIDPIVGWTFSQGYMWSNNENRDDFFRHEEQFFEATLKLLLGALTLLEEKLVISARQEDPAPKLNVARTKRGLPPVSGPSHVLQVNVPAIHNTARKTKIGTHESPCLHWRRGHWRVLHRGSEFEDKAWVNKCLVGDPAKGFVRKIYNLTNQLPLM